MLLTISWLCSQAVEGLLPSAATVIDTITADDSSTIHSMLVPRELLLGCPYLPAGKDGAIVFLYDDEITSVIAHW